MLSLRHYDGWTPQVVRTVATSGAGVPELADLIARHAAACASQRRAHGGRVRRMIAASAADWVKRRVESLDSAEFERLYRARCESGELDYASADLLVLELALRAGKNLKRQQGRGFPASILWVLVALTLGWGFNCWPMIKLALARCRC